MDSCSLTKYLFDVLVETLIYWVGFITIVYGMVGVSGNTMRE